MIVSIKPAYLDRAQAAAYVSLGTTSMEQMVCAGTFPKPRQLSAARVGWLVSELEAWCASRPVSHLLPVRNSGKRKAAKAALPTPAPSARPGA